ncbi:MAG: RNA-directed DNA polymerase [Bacteroidetes bacterium]|nr:RNA-directed DNA polymerase [Bacteroidota bacterium]
MNSQEEILSILIPAKDKIWNSFYGIPIRKKSKQLEQLKKHELNALLLLTINKPSRLAQFLSTPFFELEGIINNPNYRHYTIPKKKGGMREIYAPANSLKKIQRRLNYFLQAYYLCIKPKEVHGFVVNPAYLGKKCNIVANARLHIGKSHVLNIDVKDFFPSISAKQVKGIFSSHLFNFNDQISNALTLLTTFEGRLPAGAPTSPVISNFVCTKLDSDLIEFCSLNSLSYSRYADDLTFSSNNVIDNDIILDLINIINANNFKINDKKLRLKASNRKQTVTGLTVNEKVNVDRKLLKKIRAMLHDLTTNGIDKAAKHHFNINKDIDEKLRGKFIYRLEGYINFVGQVRGKKDLLYVGLKSKFDNEFKVIPLS